MRVTMRSQATGVVRTLDVPCTEEQYAAWRSQGVRIQDAMPDLSPAEREFLMTGTTQEEWDDMCAGRDDEGDEP